MSRQDKATTEKFTKTLRELVKQQDNKLCADCKRNDPRWASWNIGVFLCIRCSGIHRGMGTHISKVKSVDLDVWTPEQMASIQKWGNRLANLYWEAHLKPGHVPPEHKMESFIRSKYESRRWALEGPPPVDPSVLDKDVPSVPHPPPQQATPPPRPTHLQSSSISTHPSHITTRQPQPHQLLSSNYTNRPAATPNSPAVQQPSAVPPPVSQTPVNDLFSLDFHAPAVPMNNNTQAPEQKKDVKQDILSLFSAPPPASSQFGQMGNQAAYWGGAAQPQQQQQTTSMMGMNGTGMWGATSGWTAPVIPAQTNVWGNPSLAASQQQPNPLNSTAEWGGFPAASSPAMPDLFATTPAVQKKDDVFGDIWGGFK